MSGGRRLRRRRDKRAAAFHARLSKLHVQMGPAGVRWHDDDPTDGEDPDWRGAGYYYHEGPTGIAFLGLDRVQANRQIVRIVSRFRKEAHRRRFEENAPKREARAARRRAFGKAAGEFGKDLLTMVVREVVTNPVGVVKSGIEIGELVRDAVDD